MSFALFLQILILIAVLVGLSWAASVSLIEHMFDKAERMQHAAMTDMKLAFSDEDSEEHHGHSHTM